MGKQANTPVVWDLPLRLFHWLLTVSVITSVVSVKAGNMFVHEKSGITLAALLVFRLIWGFAGSHHSRFSQFLTGPAAVLAYVRKRLGGDRAYRPGHAPTGGWATVLILAVLAVMAAFGLMAHDDVLYEGPLAAWAGDFSKTATEIHHMWAKLVIAVVVLHLLALLAYRLWLKINLLPPMIHGRADKGAAGGAKATVSTSRQVAGVVLLVAVLLAAHGLGTLGSRFY